MSEEYIHLGRRLKTITSERHILSTEIARALNVNSQQVYRWHNQS